jgi:hypothetical protein
MEVFQPEFLKEPTRANLEKQMRMNADRGWPNMFTSLDYMHYH